MEPDLENGSSFHVEESTKKSGSQRRLKCCVQGCMNNGRENPNVNFHSIPETNRDKRRAWLSALGLSAVWPPQRLHVCSDHFYPHQYIHSKLRRDAVPIRCKNPDAEVIGNEGLVPMVSKVRNLVIDFSKETVVIEDESNPESSHGTKRPGDESSAPPGKILRTEGSSAPVLRNYSRSGSRSIARPVSNENDASGCPVPKEHAPSHIFRTIPVITGKRYRTYDFRQSSPLYSLDYSVQTEEIEAYYDGAGSDITLRSSFDLRLKSIIFESLKTEAYTDVVLVCGTERIRAHKVVLSAFSDFFKELLLETDGEDDAVIILDQFGYVDICNAIGLLYNGVILLKNFSEAAMVQSVLNELKIKMPTGGSRKYRSRSTNDVSEMNSAYADDSSEAPCGLNEDEDVSVLEALEKENSAVEAELVTSGANKPVKSKGGENTTASNKKSGEVVNNLNKIGSKGQCRFCSQRFPNISVRLKHERTHPDAHQPCDICGEVVFIGKRAAHLRKHREYICEHCGKMVWDVRQHLKNFHREDFVCEICNKKLSGKKRLDLHKVIIHSDEKVYPCELCVICFKTREELDDHDKSLHSRSKCPVCHLTLTKEQYRHFRNHLMSHSAEEVETVVKPGTVGIEFFKCPRCDRIFHRADYLENHLIGHYWPQWKFECTKCCMVFERSVILDRHTVDCTQGKPIKRRASTRKIRNRITPKNVFKDSTGKRYYSCPQCPKTHENAMNAHIHFQTKHNNKVSCHRCLKLFDSQEKRKEHMSIHKDSKIKYPCALCSKMISYVNMKLHLLSHAKVEAQTLSSPVCPRCSREFSAMSHVHNHLLRHYQPQRVLECPYCFLAVRNETDLKAHVERCEAIIGKKKRIRKRPTKKSDFETMWDCSECHLMFPTQRECEIHIELTH